MRKTLTTLSALLLACCLALVGCGDQSAQWKANFVGVWELDGMINDGEESSQDEIDLVKSFGLNVFLTLNEDGSASMNLFGEDLGTGSWVASSESEATLTFRGEGDDEEESVDGTLTRDGDKLLMVDEDTTFSFAQTTQEDMDEYLQSTADALEGLLASDDEDADTADKDADTADKDADTADDAEAAEADADEQADDAA